MKKIYQILFGALSIVLTFVSCSADEDYGYTHVNTVSVLKSDVVFTAKGGDGFIDVEAPGDISIKYNQGWYTASVDGHRVNIYASMNEHLVGRSSQLTIFCGADSINMTIQQRGPVFKFSGDVEVGLRDVDAKSSYTLEHDIPLDIETSESWLHASIDGDQLILSAEDNNTGHIRSGWVKYFKGEFADSIHVRQFDYDKDLAGHYDIAYTDFNDADAIEPVTLGRNEEGKTVLAFDNYGLHLPITVTDAGILQIAAAQYCGDFYGYYIFSSFTNDEDAIIVADFLGIESPFYYSEEKGTYTDLQAMHSWAESGSGSYANWDLMMCESKELSFGSYKFNLLQMSNANLVKKK